MAGELSSTQTERGSKEIFPTTKNLGKGSILFRTDKHTWESGGLTCTTDMGNKPWLMVHTMKEPGRTMKRMEGSSMLTVKEIKASNSGKKES